MRKILLPSALTFCALAVACGSTQPSNTPMQNSNATTANSSQAKNAAVGSNVNDVGVVTSHGGGNTAAPVGSSAGASLKPPVDTPELDAKIQKAEAKAKASGASDADKKAAARAYFDRADYYRDQGQPVLYKFALADYRRGLRYDPSDSDAHKKMDEIVGIYQSLGRPVPDLGNDQ